MERFIDRSEKIWRLGFNLNIDPILRRVRQNPGEMPETAARVPVRFWSDLVIMAIMIVASLFWLGSVNSLHQSRLQMALGNYLLFLGPNAITLGKEAISGATVCFICTSWIFMQNLTHYSSKSRHLAIEPLISLLQSQVLGHESRSQSLIIRGFLLLFKKFSSYL